MAEQYPCIQCNTNVTGRSHAIACDSCGRWNHRKCGTGITHQQYIQLRRGDISIAWRCADCDAQPMEIERTRHNSTAVGDEVPPPMELDVSPMRSILQPNRSDDREQDDQDDIPSNSDNVERPIPDVTFSSQVDQEFVGHDFILDDIRMNGARHIIFGTKQQIDLLRQAKRWFLDGTFKVVKEPFYQLTTINVFVKRGDDEKQVPLAYILMSRRSKDDYVTILRSLRQHLGQPLVEWFMLDYEAATWQAIREVFPGSVVKGCVFHFTQRIYRKIQAEGLATAYIQKGDKYEFLRKLMSLPY